MTHTYLNREIPPIAFHVVAQPLVNTLWREGFELYEIVDKLSKLDITDKKEIERLINDAKEIMNKTYNMSNDNSTKGEN